MVKSRKLKEKLYPEENEEEEERKLKSVEAVSSDDEEANEDLSLKIVEKHLLMRAAKLEDDDDSDDVVLNENNNEMNGSVVDLPYSSLPETDVDVGGPSGVDDDGITGDVKSEKKKSRVKKKKKKKKAESIEVGDQSVIVAEVELKMETVENEEEAAVGKAAEDPNSVEISDNIVLRKLLRGPRYFDPPDISWQTCYNCGEEGHMAVNCTSAFKQKKPCFICGSLEHGVKQCSKTQDCFICKKGGHRAKDCPERHKSGSRNAQICLKCGDYGHDLFSCRSVYPLDDIKEIQCYVCKSFGHLCCIKVTDTSPKEVSCYRCGQLGHTGPACARLRIEAADVPLSSCYKCGGEGHFARECVNSAKACARLRIEAADAPVSSCYKCGGEGHFARECVNSAKACTRLQVEAADALPSSCYKCGGEGHFARECVSSAKVRKRNIDLSTPVLRPHKENKDNSGFKSAPHDLGKAHKKKKIQHKERGITTPRKLKQRGGWITDDPEDVSYEKAKRKRWKSPTTPSSNGYKISDVTSGAHISSSQSSKKKYSDHRFTASRYSASDGMRRNYNWW